MIHSKIAIMFYDKSGEPIGGTNINDVTLDFAQGYAHCMAKEFFKDRFSKDPSIIEYTINPLSNDAAEIKENITFEKIMH